MQTNTSKALPDSGASNGTVNTMSKPALNLYRITKAVEYLAWHFEPGNQSSDLHKVCISLSQGIDYAIANGQTPPSKAIELLPVLMKQMNHQSLQSKSDDELAAVMVLMISVKNASEFGWFPDKESEENLTISNEIGKIYCTPGCTGPISSCHSSTLLTIIMERYYPNMKLGPIITSIEAKPGFGASVFDFCITKNNFQSDKKVWLLVAQTDNIETSACLISPQQVNFLVNGQAIKTRTVLGMDHQPQMPTCLHSMLKFGTNLVQAVGQFNGHYIILVAYMSFVAASLPPELPPDYVQPTLECSDSDVIEGESRISLNCPITLKRIKTPVKGLSCKHFQCFDFDNFVKMNCKRPSWRCPRCDQYVSYTEIRLDRNMIEILKKVGENVVEVIVHADGSLKEVLSEENDHDVVVDKSHSCEKEQQEYSTFFPDNVVDTCETADRKPFQAFTVGPQQRNSVPNVDSLITRSSPADSYNDILSDSERQQHFSRSLLNMMPQVSAAATQLDNKMLMQQ